MSSQKYKVMSDTEQSSGEHTADAEEITRLDKMTTEEPQTPEQSATDTTDEELTAQTNVELGETQDNEVTVQVDNDDAIENDTHNIAANNFTIHEDDAENAAAEDNPADKPTTSIISIVKKENSNPTNKKMTKQQSQVSFDGLAETPDEEVEVTPTDGKEIPVRMRPRGNSIIAWWKRFRRSVRRRSSIIYSAVFQRNKLKSQMYCVIVLLIVCLISMAVMGFFLWQLHNENQNLGRQNFICQEERDCFKDLVSVVQNILQKKNFIRILNFTISYMANSQITLNIGFSQFFQ